MVDGIRCQYKFLNVGFTLTSKVKVGNGYSGVSFRIVIGVPQ